MSIQMPQVAIDIQDFRFKLLGQVKVFEKEEQFQSNSLSLVTSASEYGLVFVAINRGFQVIQSAHLFVQEPHSGTHEYKSLPRRLINLGTSPTHLQVNCLQNYLAVVIHKDGCPHALFYDVTSFLSQSVNLINEIRLSPTSGSFVYDFLWNPGTGTSLAVCTSDGSVSLFDFTPNGINIHNLPPTTGARCLSWSPKGKQLVVGDVNGALAQYKPDLKLAKTIPGPASGQFTIYSVLWLSNFQFATIMKDNSKSEERPGLFIVNAPKTGPISFVNYGDICYGTGELRIPQFYLLHIPTWSILVVGSANSIDVGLLGLAADGVTWQQWNPDDSAWASLPLDVNKRDTFCVGMTLDTSSQKPIQWDDNKVLAPPPLLALVSHDGILCLFQAINLKPESKPLCKPSQQLQNLSGLNQFIPLDIPAASAAVSSPPPALPPAAPIPSTVQVVPQPAPAYGLSFGGPQNQQSAIFAPPTIAPAPQTSTPSLFGGSNLFGGSSTGFSIGGVSAANSIPSTANTTTSSTTSTTAFSSFTGFGSQPPASSTGSSLFASSGFFNGTPLSTGTTPASTPSIFSQPAATTSASLPTDPTAISSGLTLGGSQPYISQAQPYISQAQSTTSLSLGGSTQAPGFGSSGGPFSGFSTSLASSSLPSTTSATPPPNTSLLSSLLNSSTPSATPPPNTSLLSSLLNSSTPSATPFGQLPKATTITPVATSTVPELSHPPSAPLTTSFPSTFATPVAPRIIKLDQTPIKSSTIPPPFHISSTPISQSGSITTGKSAIGGTSLIKELEKPVSPIITTITKQTPITNNLKPNTNGDILKSKKEIEAESGLSIAVFAAALLDDMKYFNTELSELKTRVQSLDINSVHIGSESLQSRLASLDSFVIELRETTTVQCSEVDALKTELLETFSWHEEAISKMDYFKNPAITQLLELQATDPAAARKLHSIQNLSFHIESQLAQMHTVLDDAWAKKQSAKITSLKDKNQQLYIPIKEEILQTLILHTKILAARKVEVAKILERSRLPAELKDFNVTELIESDPSTSELTRKLQSMGLTSVPSNIPFSSSTGNTKKMQAYIRRLLRTRRIVPIRPSRPVYIIKPPTSTSRAQVTKEKVVTESKTRTEPSLQSNIHSQSEQPGKTNSSLLNNFKQDVPKENFTSIQKTTSPSILLNLLNRPTHSTQEVKQVVPKEDFTSTQKSIPPSPLLNLLNRPAFSTQEMKQDVPKEDFTSTQKSTPPSALLSLLNRSTEMASNFNSKSNMPIIPSTQQESAFSSGKLSSDTPAKASTEPAAASPLISALSSTTKETGGLFTMQPQTSTKPETLFSFSKAADDMFKSTSTLPAVSSSLPFNSVKPNLSGSLSQNTFKSFFQPPSLLTTTPETTVSDEFNGTFDKLSVSTSSISTTTSTISTTSLIFGTLEPIDSPGSGMLFGSTTDSTFSLNRLQKSESVSNLESIVRKETGTGEEVQNPEEGEDDDDQGSVESQLSVVKVGDQLVIQDPKSLALKDENGSGDANKLPEKLDKEESKIPTSVPVPEVSSLASSFVKTISTTAAAAAVTTQQQPLFSEFGTSKSLFSTPSANFSFGGFSTSTTSSEATTMQPTSSIVTSASETALATTSTSAITITSISSPLNLTKPIQSKADDLPPTPPSDTSAVSPTSSTTVSATPATVATTTTPATNFPFGDVTKSPTADSATSALASFSFNAFGFGSDSTTSATTTSASTATTTSSGFGGFGTNTTSNTNMFGASQPAFGAGSNEAANPFASTANFGTPGAPSTTGPVFGGAASSTQGSIFGGSGFGSNNATQNNSVFGSSTTGSVFGGQTSFSNTSNAFGSSNTAQPPATNASSIFGTPVSTASSFSGGIFKQSSFTQQHSFAAKPAFGQPTIFGQQQQSSTFGSPNSGSIFGNAAPANASSPIFGGNLFQSSSNTQAGPFSSGAGQSVAQSGFGSPTSAPTVFGSPPPGGFGGSPVFGGTPSRPSFGGSPTFGTASPQTNVFGSPPNTAGSIFGGAQQQGSSTFENLATSQNTMTFGNLAQQVGPTSTFGQAAPPVQPQNQGGSGLFGGQGASVFNSGGGNSGGGGGGGASSSGFGGSSFSSWR